MANLTCSQLLKVIAMRLIRLDAAGAFVESVSAMYVHRAPILVGYTPVTPDRERLEQLDGNGDQCLLYLGPPKAVESVTLRMDLCKLDGELMEMLTGGSIITSGYDTIGYLAPTDATVNEDGVALETWSYAWNGREARTIGGDVAYYRHVFPKSKWVGGETVMQNGVSTIPVTGTGEVNTAYATGPEHDPFPADVGESVYGWALVDEVPEDNCGYLEYPAA